MAKQDFEKESAPLKKERNAYVYYTGLGFQMIATIGIFAFIGYKIDLAKKGEVGIYTAILSLIGVCVSLVGTIWSVIKKK